MTATKYARLIEAVAGIGEVGSIVERSPLVDGLVAQDRAEAVTLADVDPADVADPATDTDEVIAAAERADAKSTKTAAARKAAASS